MGIGVAEGGAVLGEGGMWVIVVLFVRGREDLGVVGWGLGVGGMGGGAVSNRLVEMEALALFGESGRAMGWDWNAPAGTRVNGWWLSNWGWERE
jgi:hypothetical protein